MEANENKEPGQFELQYVASGRPGAIQVSARWPEGSFTDSFNVLNSVARKRFAKALLIRCPGLDEVEIERQLDRIADQVVSAAMSDDSEAPGDGDSDNKILIEIGRNPEHVELFYAGERHDVDAYARVRVGDHFELWSMKSRAFAIWIRQEFYERMRRSPSAQGFADAINTLTSIALYEGKSEPVYLRIAPFESGIVLDLCDPAWSAVVIDASGWRIVPSADVPVRFTRKRGMLALPTPVRGGSISELRPFVNITSDSAWALYVCTMVSFLRPRGPYAVLIASGEQGSAKSSLVKKTRALIDPSAAPARRLSRDERDLMIAAKNAFIQVFDNVSMITPAMSDALCSLVTGGGLSTRQLYTDDEEVLFDAMRPVVLNGIEDVATRADLLDRSVILQLEPIGERNRREEKELDAAFELARPRILGALLNAVSIALARFDSIRLTRRPRMADFARWCAAAETGLGFKEGTFADAYALNRRDAISIVMESSAVGAPIQALMRTSPQWEGTATELLRELDRLGITDGVKFRPEWPKHARGMAEAIRRIAPALRSIGISVTHGERTSDRHRTRLILLSRIDETADSKVSDDSDDSDDLVDTPKDGDLRADPCEDLPVSVAQGRDEPTTSSESSESSDGRMQIDSTPALIPTPKAETTSTTPDAGDAWRREMNNKDVWS